jgi:dihydrofolate reductase
VINLIVAFDEKMGLADDNGIPWKLDSDKKYFREKTEHTKVLMGYGTYVEFDQPLPNRQNFVVSHKTKPLKPGFELVTDLDGFIKTNQDENLWIIGGAGLFAQTIKNADRLYITRLLADFHCTKFFPDYETEFSIEQKSELMHENDIDFYFEVWKRKTI